MSSENAQDLIASPGGRKLVAVAHVDMVGYSRLIGADDIGTLARLQALRRTVIDPAIAEYGGRLVSTGGDSLLIVFDSIEGAVRCALEVQQEVPAQDGEQSPDRRMRFRIGVSIGDMIVEGSEVYGEGVNVAARLQAGCPPGCVCVSRGVRDYVGGRIDLAFEALGALDLKNIARPVEAFVLRPEASAPTPESLERLLVQDTRAALPLPDKPSIAVLAFSNLSQEPDQEYFSDGIADDIITELSRNRSLFVIARNSAFIYKGRAVDVKQVGRELGVRYLLEGSVRRAGDCLRVSAQLIDAETANHIWAERYDRRLADLFTVQDEITWSVTTAIGPAIAHAEQRRAARKPPASLSAWEAYQRGLWLMSTGSSSGNEQAREFFQRAITLDPAFAPAYSAIALVCVREGDTYVARPLAEAAKLAKNWARRAVQIDATDADAQAMLGYAAFLAGDSTAALAHSSLALVNDPNSARAIGTKGGTLLYTGRLAEARQAVVTALRLNPYDPHNSTLLAQMAVSYYFERDYATAAETAKNGVARYPDYPNTYRWLAASLGQLGNSDEARDALQKAIEVSDANFQLFTRSRPPWFRPEDHEHMLDGLRKAGWQGVGA